MRAPDATRSPNFAAGMGFALVTAVGWGLNWSVPKYLLTELPPLYLIVEYGVNTETNVELVPVCGGGAAMLAALKQGTIDGFALSANFRYSRSRRWSRVSDRHSTAPSPFFDDFLYIAVATTDRIIHERGQVSALGQKRRFGRRPRTSGLPQ